MWKDSRGSSTLFVALLYGRLYVIFEALREVQCSGLMEAW